MADAQVTADTNASNASNNPVTPKFTAYLQNFYAPWVVGQDGRTSDELLQRVYIPWDLDELQNNLRIYTPIETVPTGFISRHASVSNTPAEIERGTDFGIGDITAFDLVLQKSGNIEYGMGPLVVFPTASHRNLGTETWQAGPAGIAIATWGWGMTGATIYYSHSFAGPGSSVQALDVEPLFLYNLDNGVYLRSTAFWNIGFGTEPTFIPIGFGIGKVWKLPSGKTLNLHFESQGTAYASELGAPRWQILTGMIMQF